MMAEKKTDSEQADEKLGVAGTAQKVSENVLGDMFGIGGNKKEATELPEDKIVLRVGEDRRRLALQGTGFFLLVIVALVLTLGFWGAANLTGNVVYLLLVIFALTVAWFCSLAMGKRFGRLASKTDVVDFGTQHVFVYEKADPKKAIALTYKDIKSYTIIRQGKSLRLLLSGAWVKHPSGFHLVNISRPFMADTLDGLEEQIVQLMREKHVSKQK